MDGHEREGGMGEWGDETVTASRTAREVSPAGQDGLGAQLDAGVQAGEVEQLRGEVAQAGDLLLRPGDLVAFYSPVSHIGIYLGDGQMVHAPTSGDVVKVASVDRMGATPKFNRIAG